VVDNASTDGSIEIVEEEFAEVEVHRNGQNLGFAEGNNVGIRKAMAAGAEYVFLLNMDARLERRSLRKLVEIADRAPEAALLGAMILTEDGSLVEFDGQQFDPVTTSGGYANKPPETIVEDFRDAAYACGAGLLLRLSAIEEVGLFDESFFAYHEDVELSLRAQMYGYRVLNVPRAVVYHAGGGAEAGSDFRTFMGARNVIATLVKACDASSWRLHRTDLANHFLNPYVPLHVKGLLAACFVAPGALRRRRYLKQRQKKTYFDLIEQRKAKMLRGGQGTED